MISSECSIQATESTKTTYSVDEIAEMLSISKSSVYKFVKSGQVSFVKVGRIIRISKISFDKWLNG